MPDEEKSLDRTLFEQKQLRRVWHKEEWYYSVTDVIAILTDSTNPRVYWAKLKERGAHEGVEYAILTNEMTKGTFGFTVQAYKEYKLLPTRANLRDHMTPIELALTSLSEATAITYHRDRDSQGFPEMKRDATDAGRTAGKARRAIEEDMGKTAVSSQNYLHTTKSKRLKQPEKGN